MRDRDALLAVELARSVGRLDWWNIRGEHTPFQWSLQHAVHAAIPSGEARADLRAAVMTANLMTCQSAAEIDDADFRKMVNSLVGYLKSAQDYENEADIEAARRIMRKEAASG